MFRGAVVVVCALGAMVLGAQSAQAEPKPETPPSHSVKSPKPSPTPGAASTKSSGATASTSATTASTVVGTTATVHNSSPASSASTALRQSYTPPRRAHTAPPKPKPDRASPKLGQLFELRVLAGLRDLPSVESPTSSGWLLAAGFALVLLVVAETSFLGLAGSRFGVGGDPSAGKRRPAEEPLAIRRVQLRR
jgi:Predicted solute binding protein